MGFSFMQYIYIYIYIYIKKQNNNNRVGSERHSLHTDSISNVGNTQGRVAQSVENLARKSGVLGSIPGLATYFRFSFRFFKKGSCQLLAKVCARSTG